MNWKREIQQCVSKVFRESLPVQLFPSPMYPFLQPQVYDPSLLVHSALGAHWFVPGLEHSSISAVKDRHYTSRKAKNSLKMRENLNTLESYFNEIPKRGSNCKRVFFLRRNIYLYSFYHRLYIHWHTDRRRSRPCCCTQHWDHNHLFQRLHTRQCLCLR